MKLLVVSCILIPLSSYLFQVLAQPIQKENREIIHKKEEVNEAIRQTLKGFYIIQAYQLRELFKKRFQDCTEGLKEREKKKDRIDMVLGRVYILLGYIPHLLVPLYGGYLGIRGEITLGDLIAVNMMIWYVLNPVQTFLSVLREKKDIVSILEQMQIVFAVQGEYTEEEIKRSCKGSVADKEAKKEGFNKEGSKKENRMAENVKAGNVKAEKPVIEMKHVSFSYDGIEENIRLGEEAVKKQVEFAAAMAEAHSFIMDFEKGYQDKTILIISHKPSDFLEYSCIARLDGGVLKN